MITFKRDENGVLVAYRDGKPVGPIVTMGDDVTKDDTDDAENELKKE